MTSRNTRATIEATRERIREGKRRLDEIRTSAEGAKPGLQAAANEVEDALEDLLRLGDRVGQDLGTWGWVRPFIRRLASREFIIAVVAVIAIWTGELRGQEAIAVAVAGGGLALGRGVAKAGAGG